MEPYCPRGDVTLALGPPRYPALILQRAAPVVCFLSRSSPSGWRGHRSYLESQTQRPHPQRWGVNLSRGGGGGPSRRRASAGFHITQSRAWVSSLHFTAARLPHGAQWCPNFPPPEHGEGKFPFPLFPAAFAQAAPCTQAVPLPPRLPADA